MVQANNRRKGPSVRQMKASGMTDEEIAEIVDMESEFVMNQDQRDKEIHELQEITYLESKATKGELD